jgi:hypothetical protein
MQFFLSGLLDLGHELKLTWSMAGNMYTDPQLRVTQAGNRAESRLYALNDYAQTSTGRLQLVEDVRRDFSQ